MTNRTDKNAHMSCFYEFFVSVRRSTAPTSANSHYMRQGGWFLDLSIRPARIIVAEHIGSMRNNSSERNRKSCMRNYIRLCARITAHMIDSCAYSLIQAPLFGKAGLRATKQ